MFTRFLTLPLSHPYLLLYFLQLHVILSLPLRPACEEIYSLIPALPTARSHTWDLGTYEINSILKISLGLVLSRCVSYYGKYSRTNLFSSWYLYTKMPNIKGTYRLFCSMVDFLRTWWLLNSSHILSILKHIVCWAPDKYYYYEALSYIYTTTLLNCPITQV